MRAITLHQPWASLIALGIKRVETRSWIAGFRGQLAIHAAKRPIKRSELEAIAQHKFNGICLGELEYPLGSVVAVCTLSDCVLMTPKLISQQSPTELAVGDWESGRYAWLLSNVQPTRVIPASGKQGLWDWIPPSNLL